MASDKARELANRIWHPGPPVVQSESNIALNAEEIDAAVKELVEAAYAYLYAPSPVEVVNRAPRLRAALEGWTK